MAETDGEFEIGARVWLMLPGRDRANAVVKWVAGDKIGARVRNADWRSRTFAPTPILTRRPALFAHRLALNTV